MANWYQTDLMAPSPTQINFLIFAASWSILSVIYLEVVAKFVPRGKCPFYHAAAFILLVYLHITSVSHPWAALAVQGSNVLFHFAGFIALAVFLSQLLFCHGTVCGSARAGTAFSAFLCAIWGLTVFLAASDMSKSGFRRQPGASTAGIASGNVGGMKETMA